MIDIKELENKIDVLKKENNLLKERMESVEQYCYNAGGDIGQLKDQTTAIINNEKKSETQG